MLPLARWVLLWAATVSLAVHLCAALALIVVPLAPVPAPWESEVAIGLVDGTVETERLVDAAEVHQRIVRVVPGGRESVDNIDNDALGQGGQAQGAVAVIMLLPNVDLVTVQDSPMNTTGAGQTQRIDTSSSRTTHEPRRATPHPADAAFLASGDGVHRERRPRAELDARRGARHAPEVAHRGGLEDRPAHDSQPGAGSLPSSEPSVAGAPAPSPGVGIQHGRGPVSAEAAAVAHDRPPVDRGRAATIANERATRVQDSEDAELLAASMIQSMVESTRRRGQEAGSGAGGEGERGTPGSSGATGDGGRATPHSPGVGTFSSLDTSDPRYLRWFLSARQRVSDRLRFPRDRQLAMDQGTSVFRLVVRRDGTLAVNARLLRSSGYSDFDRAAELAIERAAPFEPFPDELAPGRGALPLTMPIEFSNPMVR